MELLSSTPSSQLVGLVHPRGAAQLQLMLGNADPRFVVVTQYVLFCRLWRASPLALLLMHCGFAIYPLKPSSTMLVFRLTVPVGIFWKTLRIASAALCGIIQRSSCAL
jgi:hypothetical protein